MITMCCDPGLKNFSLCVMNSQYEILLWDVYNVLDSDNFTCQGIFKNNKICNRKCTMKYNKDNNLIYTCKSHFPKDIKKTKQNEYKKKNIDEYLLQDIAKSFNKYIQDLYDENSVFKQLDSILIELQPSCNKKMIFISHILYGKLVELYKDTTTTIKFVRASQKLKAYTGPHIECKLKGAYAKRKWLSVQYGYWILENKFSNEQRDLWLPFLNSKTKRDDIFDVFNMAINSISGIPKKQLKHKNGNELK